MTVSLWKEGAMTMTVGSLSEPSMLESRWQGDTGPEMMLCDDAVTDVVVCEAAVTESTFCEGPMTASSWGEDAEESWGEDAEAEERWGEERWGEDSVAERLWDLDAVQGSVPGEDALARWEADGGRVLTASAAKAARKSAERRN